MKILLVSILLLGFASSANAAIIDNGSYTTDTVSGLDWLDLTESTGRNYNYVSSQFGVGGLYEGYRYASFIEFNNFVTNYTGTAITCTSCDTFFTEGSDSIDGLVSLLGNTLRYTDAIPDAFSYGFIGDVQSNGNASIAVIYDFNEILDNKQDFARAYWGYTSPDIGSREIGSYLVRESSIASVPESASLYLLAFGLLGLFGAARCKV